jgi:hypothetical protein
MIALCLAMMIATSILGGTKDSGTTILKDFQPAGTTDKHHKNQQYDLLFASAAGKEYTCRTSEKNSVKATDYVVGTNLTYKIDDNKAKVKTSSGKELTCTIVRVANVTAASSR